MHAKKIELVATLATSASHGMLYGRGDRRMKKQRYCIKLYDQPLAAFDFIRDGRNPWYACGLEIDPVRRHLLPLNIATEPTDDELGRFLGSRRIPKNRAFAEEILQPYKISLDDTKGIIDITKGTSINDSYLVVAENDPTTFSECNLFENDFNIALQIAAYSGIISGDALRSGGMPSELTASGSFPKAWRIINGRRILYKAGDVRPFASKRITPFSEHLAYQVASAMGISAVAYQLEQWHGQLCSTCELMNTKDISFVSLYSALTRKQISRFGVDSALEFFYSISPEASTAFVSMLAFDSIVANKDRHFGNYGILRDNSTGKILEMAPLFDHNLSLFCDEPDSALSLDQLIDAEKRYSAAFGSNLYSQIEFALEPSQIPLLERIVEFEFELDEHYFDLANNQPELPEAFPRKRLDLLGQFVRHKATEALDWYRSGHC